MTKQTPIIRAYRRRRIYDPVKGCYVYDIRFKTRSTITDRTIEVSRAFGLGIDDEKEHIIFRDFNLRLTQGDIAYVTGDSGSGKSVLLKALTKDLGDQAADINDVEIDAEKPLIDTLGDSFQEAITLLSRVGLNDAFLFLRRYNELSDGQRYRYRIAKMIDAKKPFWLADEFASTLDRTTARIVAYNIQKMARRTGATLIVATTHTDLEEDLNPSIRIHKGWGEQTTIDYRPNIEAPTCTATQDITIAEGTYKDYKQLSYLHYRDEESLFRLKTYKMQRQGELIGVITYNNPPISTSGRKQATDHNPTIQELNKNWATIKRVIIHPKYRTTGLGTRLVKETLPLCGRRHVELIAVMAQYNPFAEKAGMQKILETQPHPKILLAVEQLRDHGFNPILLASEKQNQEQLHKLSQERLNAVRQILLDLPTLYHKRLIGGNTPYYKREDTQHWLQQQGIERLAKCLHTLSILSETKAYLYWNKDWLSSRDHSSSSDWQRGF